MFSKWPRTRALHQTVLLSKTCVCPENILLTSNKIHVSKSVSAVVLFLALDFLLLGLPGGKLFQLWVHGFGSNSSQMDLRRAADKTDRTLWYVMLQQNRLPFYNFLVSNLLQLGRFVDNQVMARNLVAELRGLSKVGRTLFSKLGILLSERTYQRRLLDFDSHHEQRMRSPPKKPPFFLLRLLSF